MEGKRNTTKATSSTKRKKENLSAKILDTLKGRILNWEYPPKKPLLEEELCREFGVSRSPVREALRLLAAAGFAERRQRTFVVKQIHPSEIREIYELRKALELYVVERLCDGKGDRDRLDELQRQWEEYSQSGYDDTLPDHKDVALWDQTFHEGLAEIYGNKAIIDTLRSLSERLHIFRVMDFQQPGRVQATCSQHLAIIEAIQEGQTSLARERLLRNIEEGEQNAKDGVQKALLQSFY